MEGGSFLSRSAGQVKGFLSGLAGRIHQGFQTMKLYGRYAYNTNVKYPWLKGTSLEEYRGATFHENFPMYEDHVARTVSTMHKIAKDINTAPNQMVAFAQHDPAPERWTYSEGNQGRVISGWSPKNDRPQLFGRLAVTGPNVTLQSRWTPATSEVLIAKQDFPAMKRLLGRVAQRDRKIRVFGQQLQADLDPGWRI